ncbi:MAG: UDP-glucose/GDP-mannose dehydrogenase family protein [Gemmatimonadota bacterium]|nr:UDP-glucose/GDP-mannose dehydrogenase family protein [Gemmatimonadota bacterium]
MNIAVIGTGYVGLVAGACLAETGNSVVCADLDEYKIGQLLRNEIPIYEPGLDAIVARNQADGRLAFTTDVERAVAAAEVVFIAVGTPPDEDGSADLSHVLAVADMVGRCMARETVVVTKSTVPVGTARHVKESVARHARFPFHVVSNPEFLKEGAAVEDFLRPDRVVLGVESEQARSVMGDLYAPFVRTGRPIIYMDVASAEMTKYAANGMLATRIGFMNEIAALCEATGADVDEVRRGLGSDTRIGPSFLFPGPGYGGSCFPKDVKALVRTAAQAGLPLAILASVDSSNERQKRRLGEKVRAALTGDSSRNTQSPNGNSHNGIDEFATKSLQGYHLALWGLSFKPGTDDMREAPALVLIEQLLGWGATVCAHDPAAVDEARRRLGDQGGRIAYAETGYDALRGADALVIVTDWNEYRHPDFKRLKATLRRPVVIDGRNLYDPHKMCSVGLTYYSIGRRSVGVQEATA